MCTTSFSALSIKDITPTLWKRAGVMADRQGLSSLHSLCAREQVSSSGNLVFESCAELAPLTLCWRASFLLRKLGIVRTRSLLCWGVSFLLQKLGVINCRDTRHYVEHSNFVLSPVYKRHYPNPLERAGVMADRQGFEPWIPFWSILP